MTKTFLELKEIDEVVANLYKKNDKLRNSRFGYWYGKFYKKNIQPTATEMEEKLADCKLENALSDPKTHEILYTEYTDSKNKVYKFSKDGMKALMVFVRKLNQEYDEKEIEVIPCISKEVPEELNEDERELLTGLVI